MDLPADLVTKPQKGIVRTMRGITDRRMRLNPLGVVSHQAHGEVMVTVAMAPDEMVLQGMDPRAIEIIHASQTQQTAIRALALGGTTKVKGHTTLELDHQGHISPMRVHKGHTAPWTIETRGHLMLRETQRQGHLTYQTSRSEGHLNKGHMMKGHISQGQSLHLRHRTEAVVSNVEFGCHTDLHRGVGQNLYRGCYVCGALRCHSSFHVGRGRGFQNQGPPQQPRSSENGPRGPRQGDRPPPSNQSSPPSQHASA